MGDDNINGIQFSYPQSSSDAGSAVIEAHIEGAGTGEVLCSCPKCIENAARILEEVVFAD